MMFRILIPCILFIGVNFANAQNSPRLKFEEETFDFGKIKEEDGPVEHKFVFTNTGNVPLTIAGVRSSCGCTTPSWTKEPVLPGKKGFIIAKYNPRNRPGSFRKSLTITSNAEPQTKAIYISGMVEPKQKTPADEYQHKIGDLRLRYLSLNMGKITTEKPFSRSFDIYNDGDKDISFTDQMELPEHIKISVQPTVLAPKSVGKIIVTYDAKARNDFGFLTDPVMIKTTEDKDAEKRLRVVATIEEYFPPMTPEQLKNAPKLKFSSNLHDFGNIQKGQQLSTEFSFTNTGKEKLNIRKIKTNCDCVVTDLDKDSYKSGASGTIKVTFNSTNRRGNQQKSIIIFSNDPSAPTQRLIIKAKINE